MERQNENSGRPRGWIHVAKLNRTPGSPIRTSTAYKWHHIRRFPELFKQVGGKLFLDMDLLFKKAEAGKLR
jgi:hypothetical protein